MAKQIPELTNIPTPVAGNETNIETVVAKHSDGSTFRMFLSQIFSLAAISWAIKIAMDALQTQITSNTNSITSLGTTKLNAASQLRTWLTANRWLITDNSGNEGYLTGTTAQVVWFDSNGKPIPVTPSMDIQGLTTKNTPITADKIPIYDSESGLPNKNFSPNSINLGQYGNGSDGNITISGTVTMTSDKQYKDVTLSDGCILKTNWFKLYISGTLTRSGTWTWYIDVSWTAGWNGQNGMNRFSGGAAGGTAGTIAYTTGTLPAPVTCWAWWNNTGTGPGNGTAQTKCLVKQNGAAWWAAWTSYYTVWPATYTTAAAWSGGTHTATDNPLITLFDLNLLLSLLPPSGIVWSTVWASSWGWATTTTNYTATWGGGWAWANWWVLWVSVRDIVSVGASAIFRSKWWNGGNGWDGFTENSQQFGGGGGGWGGGNGWFVVVIYSTSNVTVSTIVDVTGWTGWTGGTKAPGNPFNTNGSNGWNGANGLLVTYTI